MNERSSMKSGERENEVTSIFCHTHHLLSGRAMKKSSRAPFIRRPALLLGTGRRGRRIRAAKVIFSFRERKGLSADNNVINGFNGFFFFARAQKNRKDRRKYFVFI